MAVDGEFEYTVLPFRFLTERSERLRPGMAWLLLALKLGCASQILLGSMVGVLHAYRSLSTTTDDDQ